MATLEIFKVLDAEQVKRFQEWGEAHVPTESWSWETLHPVVRAVWHKTHKLCLVCGGHVDGREPKCTSRDHANQEPPRVLLLSYLNAVNMERFKDTFKWYPGDGFWGGNVNGIFCGVEVDGYVHS